VKSDAKPALLIVDDDPLITDTLHFVLSHDFEVFVAESRQQVKSLLTQLDNAPPLALVDLGLPPSQHKPDEGFALITDLLNHSKKTRILVLSGQNDEANARHARALGAIDFIAKPAEPERIKQALLPALRFDQEQAPTPAVAPESDAIVGSSFAVDRLRNQIKLYADAPFPVLIEGESGSGKELVAKSLHQWSKRSGKPYLALNCAAISPTLVEPTLFGYAKGAFTGANQAHPGYFEDARDGTLFLTYEGLDRPQPVDRAGLVAKVRGFVQADPQLSVYVAGDRDASYQTVYEVLTLLQRDAKVSRAGLMGAPADSAKAK